MRKSLICEVEALLAEQALVLDGEFWKLEKSNDGGLLKAMESMSATGSRESREARLATLKAVNTSVHEATDRQHAVDLKQSLKKLHGDMCYLCGAPDDSSTLQVDHVVPLARSGAPRDIGNLQLLCEKCNNGKRDLESRLLPQALRTNVNAEPTLAIRFKRLMVTGVHGDGDRTRGKCETCDATSKHSSLVVVGSPPLAANLITSKVTCIGECS